MAQLELETRRLYLRPVADQDSAATAELMTPNVAANLTTWPPSMSPQMAYDRIRLAQQGLAARKAVELSILDRLSRKLLGWISVGIFPNAGEDKARAGFWLGTAYQGRGMMLEAAEAAIPTAARFLSIQSLEACVYPWNERGIGLIRRLEFDPTGKLELFSPVRDRLEEALLFERALHSPSVSQAIQPESREPATGS